MELIYYMFLLLVLGVLSIVVARPSLIYQFPYFMAAGFAAFIVPQAIALHGNPFNVPEGSFDKVILLCLLSLGACVVAYRLPVSKRLQGSLYLPLSEKRWLLSSAAFIVIAFFFDWKIRQLPPEELGASWTGIATVYAFFAGLIYVGFGMAMLSFARRPSTLSLLIVLVASIIPLTATIFYGRREPTALFLLTIGLSLFFERGWKPPRIAVVLAIVGAMVFIPATTAYRKALSDVGTSAITQINFINIFENYVKDADVPELTNACYAVEATSILEQYQYGAGYWNQMVFRYVPAQFVGQDVKAALMFDVDNNAVEQYFGYTMPIGSTTTGLADAFQQFGYFGFIFFGLMAVIAKNLWVVARTSDNLAVRCLYIFGVTTAIRGITHQTVDYLPGMAYAAIFLWVAMKYSRKKIKRRPDTRMALPPRPASL